MAEDTERSAWSRPGFITAAAIVGILIVAGIVVSIVIAVSGGNEEPVVEATSTPAATADADDASVCGIGEVKLSGKLTTAPDATWEFQGTTPYPTSRTAGPGLTSDTGVRTCFEHTPAGALFMAANAVAQGSDAGTGTEWAQTVLAQGTYRDDLVSQLGTPSAGAGTRLEVVGFRVLTYTGETARIDLAIQGSAVGTALNLSAVYELVWQDGDWKLSADTQTPLDMATIPDVAGYISWGA